MQQFSANIVPPPSFLTMLGRMVLKMQLKNAKQWVNILEALLAGGGGGGGGKEDHRTSPGRSDASLRLAEQLCEAGAVKVFLCKPKIIRFCVLKVLH